MWYTIEYLDKRGDAVQPLLTPMLFRDRDAALSNALALLQAGFSVSKVTGPDFEMNQVAFAAYAQARMRRER